MKRSTRLVTSALSTLFAFCLAFSMVPIAAFADEPDTAGGDENTELATEDLVTEPVSENVDAVTAEELVPVSAADEVVLEPQATVIYSGTWGTCDWTIDSDGVLTVGGGTGANTTGKSPWIAYKDYITSVQMGTGYDDKVIAPANISHLFEVLYNMEDADFNYFDASASTDMSYMFRGCAALVRVWFDNDFFQSATTVSHMFEDCISLRYVGGYGMASSSNVTNMSYLFYNCENLDDYTSTQYWNADSVTNMESMFEGCSNMSFFYFGNDFDTSHVTNMARMFYGCSSARGIECERWDVTSVQDMSSMFAGCTSLESSELDLSTWNVNGARNLSHMFDGCTGITELLLTNWMPNDLSDCSSMFKGCTSLNMLDIYGLDTNNATVTGMFEGCNALEQVTVGNAFNFKGTSGALLPGESWYSWAAKAIFTPTQIAQNRNNIFDIYYRAGATSGTWGTCPWSIDLTTGKLTIGAGEGTYVDSDTPAPWAGSRLLIKSVEFGDTVILPNSMMNAFEGCGNLESVDFSNVDMNTNSTNLHSAFKNCKKLTSFDFTTTDWSSASNLSEMFYGCTALSSVTFGNADFSNVWSMSHMFDSCVNLTDVDLSRVTTSTELSQIYYLFNNCEQLKTADLSGLNTRSDTPSEIGTYYIFNNCANLESFTTGESLVFDGRENTDFGLLRDSWYSSHDSKFYTQRAIYTTRSGIADTYRRSAPADFGSGTWGTCPWTVDKYGVLTIGAGTGADLSSTNAPWYSYRTRITEVQFEPTVVAPASIQGMFRGCTSLSGVTYGASWENFDTSATTDMSYMFEGCTAATYISLTDLNFTNVTTMTGMFKDCTSLQIAAPYSNSVYDSHVLVDTSHMYENCVCLREQYHGFLDMSHVTNMGSMFKNCKSMDWFSVDGWDTSNVLYMDEVFAGCESAEGITCSNWDTPNVTTMEGMFEGCTNLYYTDSSGSFDLSAWDTGEVTDMSRMFYGCETLGSAEHGYGVNITGWDTGKVLNMSEMFAGCTTLKDLDLTGWNTAAAASMVDMFVQCNGLRTFKMGTGFSFKGAGSSVLTTLPGERWRATSNNRIYTPAQIASDRSCIADTYTYEVMSDVASGTWGTCPWTLDLDGNLVVGAGEGTDTSASVHPDWYDYREGVKTVTFQSGVVAPQYMQYIFDGYTNLTAVDFSGVDFATNSTSLDYAFRGCTALASTDAITGLGSGVISFEGMFRGCAGLINADVSGWDFSEAVYLQYMFQDCSSLETTDFGMADLRKCRYMQNLFAYCYALTNPGISQIRTSDELMYISGLFYYCSALKNADLSGINGTKLYGAGDIFFACDALQSWKVGRDFRFTLDGYDSSPYDMSLPATSWQSAADGNTYTVNQIMSTRSGLADTYYRSTVVLTVQAMIDALPAAADITQADRPLVKAVRAAYDALSPELQGLVDATKLFEAEAVLVNRLYVYAGVAPDYRFDTARRANVELAATLAAEGNPAKGVIVVAGQGAKFPDALSAAGLSGISGYPVVMVSGQALTDSDRATLAAFSGFAGGDLEVLILGDANSVSDAAQAEIEASYGHVPEGGRIAGADRYLTNQAVYAYGAERWGWNSEYAFVARGDNFPDALSIAPFLAANGCPLLLVDPKGTSLTADQLAMVSGAAYVAALGDANSVPAALYTAAGCDKRLCGEGTTYRYGTSAAIAAWETSPERGACRLGFEGAGIATGTKFPDALGSASLLGHDHAVLLLANPAQTAADGNAPMQGALAGADVSMLRVFGGPDAQTVPVTVYAQAAAALGWGTHYEVVQK